MALINVIFSDKQQELASALKRYSSVYVVADRNIARSIAEPIVSSFIAAGVKYKGMYVIKATESRKSFKTVKNICRWLLNNGADRDSLLIAIGGGITTDLAGFAACVYKRGIRYANVPTTLLAQVDAAIGGKTACNIDSFKNMAGIIKQPEFTYINADYLESLPESIFMDGYAELVKAFVISNPQLYETAVSGSPRANIKTLVKEAVLVKSGIVERDEFENGERRVLNLGHTFAHAIEYKSSRRLFGGRISHGKAVAMGMIMAARKSEALGIAQPGLAEKMVADFSRVGLEVNCPWTEEELQEIIRTDKKAKGGKVNYVLIEQIGKVVVKAL